MSLEKQWLPVLLPSPLHSEAPAFFDIPAKGARFPPSKVGLRGAETAFQNFETPPWLLFVVFINFAVENEGNVIFPRRQLDIPYP